MEEGALESEFSLKESPLDECQNELHPQASCEDILTNPKSSYQKEPERLYRTLLFDQNSQGRNWLEKIKELNRGKWGAKQHQFESWLQSFLSYFELAQTDCELNGRKSCSSNRGRIQLYEVREFRERVYLIQIRREGKEEVGVTVRSPQGEILAYERGEAWRKFFFVTRFCKRVDRKSWILIRDECRQEPDSSSEFLSSMPTHIIVYTSSPLHDPSLDSKSTESIQRTKKSKPKVSDLLQLMDLIKELEEKEDLFFQENKRQDGEFDSLFWNFSLQNPEKTKQDFLAAIKQAAGEMGEHEQLQRINADKHYPGYAGQRKKQKCVECCKAKTEIRCVGCFLIWKVNIHLCEGSCYKKYHDHLAGNNKRRAAIATENEEFLSAVGQIDRVLDEFVQAASTSKEESSIGRAFLQYLHAKTMEEMNSLAARDP